MEGIERVIKKNNQKKISRKQAENWCNSQGGVEYQYFETSAKEAIAVDEAFQAAANHAIKKSYIEDDTAPFVFFISLLYGHFSDFNYFFHNHNRILAKPIDLNKKKQEAPGSGCC